MIDVLTKDRKEIIFNPPLMDIHNVLATIFKNIVDSGKGIPRV